MNLLKPSLFIAIFSFTMAGGSAVANTLSSSTQSQSTVEFGANYSLFEYKDADSLIKSVHLLEKFGFKADVVAETLDLNSYMGSVITFEPSPNGKTLSSEDALAAFRNFMTPRQFAAQDSIVIKNTPLSVNEGGAVLNQSYRVVLDGQLTEASQPLQLPKDGLCLTVVKTSNGKLLIITTTR